MSAGHRHATPAVETRHVRTGTGTVAVDVYGDADAPAAVVVPGALSDARAWRHVAARLRSWGAVAVVNRRGRAPSTDLPPAYSLRTEVDDVLAVLDTFDEVEALVGWSYGGLIALSVADVRPVPHVVAYEPVMAPFGASALAALDRAERGPGRDAVVETVLREVTGLGDADVEALRSDERAWAELSRLAGPVVAETRAINEAGVPEGYARRAGRVDLVVGGVNRGCAPYGTSFEDVARLTPHARVHELPGQGHLAHLEAPDRLAELIDDLAAAHRLRRDDV